MHRWLVPLAGVALALALVTAAACSGSDGATSSHEGSSHAPPEGGFTAHVYDPPREIADFTLIDQNGRPFRLSDTDGTVRLFYFGYTNCPDICPTTLLTWKRVREELGDHAEHVTFIMVTVDPEQDTPEVLGRYVTAFHPSFIGLTGPMEDLTRVWADFGVQVQKEPQPDSAAGYSVGHTAAVFAVDPERRLRLKFPFGATPEQIALDVRRLME